MLKHNYIGTEHILLGLVSAEQTDVAALSRGRSAASSHASRITAIC